MNRPVYVNEAFRPQRVSGQQRYAIEVTDRLPGSVQRVAPGRFFSRSALCTWIWVQTVLPLRTWRGALISLTARSPLWHPRHVLVIHDLFVIDQPEWFSRKFHLTHAPLLRLQLATVRCFAAVSEPVAEQIRERHLSGTTVVAPNAPSGFFAAGDYGSTQSIAVLAEFGLRPGEYLLVVGNMDPRKNLARLAEAFGKLPESQRKETPLVVVGGNAEIYAQASITWPSETVITGYVSDTVLRTLYAGAMAMVFPSLAEGFGLPIVEAVLAGVPRLLLSDIPVFRWICGAGAGYVDPTSVDELATALHDEQIKLIPPPDLGLIGRFDWAETAKILHDAALTFGRVAGGPSPHRPRRSWPSNSEEC